jgi:predicted helicase
MSVIGDYLSKIQKVEKSGKATEHSYRSAIEFLFHSLDEGVTALNEPKRVECGAPDFIIERKGIIIGHVEAKDLGVDLRSLKGANKEQQERYLNGLPNLIYTNGLDFEFFRDSERIATVSIATYEKSIEPKPEKFEELENLLKDFLAQHPQTITSPAVLARKMAGKANLIKDVFGNVLRADKEFQSTLAEQYQIFKEQLIHDITPEDFADIYAETIAYGMFAARLHDSTLDTFSRQEALELLPKSNPFLRNLFGYIAGPDLDDRIKWIIDDLAEVFQACDLGKLMSGFGKLTGRNDPFLHFYETFLAAYNPAKRKARGVWYTPEPVVNFIVRAVDEVLQKEFGLADGLADTSKVVVDWDTGQTDKKAKAVTIKKEVHRVQILDPAVGTGTFLAEVVKQIAPKVKGVAEGMWSAYIEKDLIPRLHGFELLMASYAMCHMKLDMVLTELGYKPTGTPPRLGVYLTNSLEEGEPANQTLPFAQWLSNEVKQANTIKRDMPIMVVIGNPPYSGHSANNGEWMNRLLDVYKKEPGGKERLKERNPKWLNDDYVKFIRLSEHLIEKNGEGILGFITNHGYLDNPTFRGMRWHLLKTFDQIHILDLHGSTKKKDKTPSGTSDVNVFDIQPGVAIVIAAKTSANNRSKTLASLKYAELWGERATKYDALWKTKIDSSVFESISPETPQFLFVKRNHKLNKSYEAGFSVEQAFPLGVMGFQTHRDNFAIAWNRDEISSRCQELRNLTIPNSDLALRYDLKDNAGWKLAKARAAIANDRAWNEKISPCGYRPLDVRTCYLSDVTMDRPRKELIQHGLNRRNIFIGIGRQGLAVGAIEWCLVTCSSFPMDANLFRRGGLRVSPLYLYPSDSDLDQTRRINFDQKLWKKLKALAKDKTHGEPDEIATFDYIYGVLHCPEYRETYAEFLKSDFPRIPWPSSPEEFWSVSEKGGMLRRLHLMEPDAVGETSCPFKGEGDNTVDKPRFEKGKVFINATQYFDNVPEVSWNFFIGGYQPAQKWLKDRKTRALTFDDVKHYQKIIKILAETDRIMKTIEMDLSGGAEAQNE